MLRQLWRLTEPVPAAGPDALAIAIYEHPDGVVTARESGFEGVACVDDTARLLDVLCSIYEAHEAPLGRALGARTPGLRAVDAGARRLLAQLRARLGRGQEPRRHHLAPGQNFWLARALVGVGHAAEALDDERARPAFLRGISRAAAEDAPPDIRSLHLLAALRSAEAGDRDVIPWIRAWAQELVDCRDGVVLKNSAYEVGAPHLWAHIQEGVLATTGALLDDAALTSRGDRERRGGRPAGDRARRSRGRTRMAYEVSSCVVVADRLHAATGEDRWSAAAADARAWFDGRNLANAPTYDPVRGRVADGIDENRVSANSGAESNISGADALLDRAIAVARAMPDPFDA